MRRFTSSVAAHYHEGESLAARQAQIAREAREADQADEARGWIGGDGPFVADASDLLNGDQARDLGRRH